MGFLHSCIFYQACLCAAGWTETQQTREMAGVVLRFLNTCVCYLYLRAAPAEQLELNGVAWRAFWSDLGKGRCSYEVQVWLEHLCPLAMAMYSPCATCQGRYRGVGHYLLGVLFLFIYLFVVFLLFKLLFLDSMPLCFQQIKRWAWM